MKTLVLNASRHLNGRSSELAARFLKKQPYQYEDDDRTISDRRQLLVDEADRIQLQINDLVDAHEYLQYKIDNYYGHM